MFDLQDPKGGKDAGVKTTISSLITLVDRVLRVYQYSVIVLLRFTGGRPCPFVAPLLLTLKATAVVLRDYKALQKRIAIEALDCGFDSCFAERLWHNYATLLDSASQSSGPQGFSVLNQRHLPSIPWCLHYQAPIFTLCYVCVKYCSQ